jgi:Holliday junction DNA helicase RuvA
MIGKLKGIIDTISDDHLIVDVNGVGYVVFVSANTLRNITAVGEAVALLIITHVREDAFLLFGFLSESEKEWFTTLTKVNGVGNKMAMAVLSGLTPDALQSAIISQDKAAFKPIAGVGPKLAERIISELKDKVGSIGTGDFAKSLPANSGDIKSKTAAANNISADAISALANLGYGRSEAYAAISEILKDNPEITLENLIREGLKKLTRR